MSALHRRNVYLGFSNSLLYMNMNHSYSRNVQIQNLKQKHYEISKSKENIFVVTLALPVIRKLIKMQKRLLILTLQILQLPFTILSTGIFCRNDSFHVIMQYSINFVRQVIRKDYPVIQSLKREGKVQTHTRIGHTLITH